MGTAIRTETTADRKTLAGESFAISVKSVRARQILLREKERFAEFFDVEGMPLRAKKPSFLRWTVFLLRMSLVPNLCGAMFLAQARGYRLTMPITAADPELVLSKVSSNTGTAR